VSVNREETLVRVQSKINHGNAVCWNGSNVDEVRAVAGENFAGLHSDCVLVRHTSTAEGPAWVRPGWWIIRWDGSDDILVSSARAFAGTIEAEPETARA
jgi:hypothetical protein